MDSGSKSALEQRVYAGERLTRDDGIVLFGGDDLAWLGRLAHHRRTESHADRVTFAADRAAVNGIDAGEVAYGRAGDPAVHLVDAVLNLRELSADARPASLVLVKEDGAPAEALRTFAVARLLLDPAVHLTVDFGSHGPALTQLALNFGADDLSGIPAADDEREPAGEGSRWRNADKRALERDAVEELVELIWDAGLRPVERDAAFGVVRAYDAPIPLAERRVEPQQVWA